MDFLYIISKQEFTSLYRFGFIPLIQQKILELKGLPMNEIERNIIESFMSLPYFIGDEEYLFIGFNQIPGSDNKLLIDDVLEIIPLTSAARHSYQMKFDKKIVFSQAKFEKVVNKVEEQIDFHERLNGAKALWQICKIQEPFNDYLEDDKVKEAYQKRIHGAKSDSFSSDFFVHLLVYDRYEIFPKSKLGYFYDLGEIFAHMNNRPSFIGTSYYQFLESIKVNLTNAKLSDIIDFFEKQEETKKIRTALTHGGLRKYLAAILFFEFKEALSQNESMKDTNITAVVNSITRNKDYKNELNHAIYLTGLFFGYEKFYDDLYEIKELEIFKTPDIPSAKTKTESKGQENEQKLEQGIRKQEPNENSTLDNNVPDNVELPEKKETEKKLIQRNIKDKLIHQFKELIQKSGDKVVVKGDVYQKSIKKIINQNVENPKELKTKQDYLRKINELTENYFNINMRKNKETIEMKDNPDLFTNS